MAGKCVCLAACVMLGGAAWSAAVTVDDVMPFVGTAGTGHVFPGPCRPFALVQPSPDTGNGSWRYCGGYAWEDGAIRRFSQTHVNGAGQAGLGDVGILPFAGDLPLDPAACAAPFAKSNEVARLGAYDVVLNDGVKVEIASGRRTARYRVTFPRHAKGGVLLDFPYGLYREESYLPHLTTTCRVTCVSNRRLNAVNHSEVWAPRDIASVIVFSKDAVRIGKVSETGKGPIYAAWFNAGETVEITVALSARSLAGAERNLDAEAAFSFEKLREDTRKAWRDLLGRVEATGATPAERQMVATCLYRLLLQPNDISDAGETPRYSTFSLWDTFRDAHPLYEELVPEKVDAFVQSLLDHYRHYGYLPQWELWGRETGGMIGSHAVAVIVSAFEHGFRGFDAEEAYRAVRATLRSSDRPGKGLTYPRRTDWEVLDRYGYYPYDVIRNQSVSRTLECCYDDFCAATFARALGKREDAAFFERRSWAFTNLFDKGTCCFRPKDAAGNFIENFNPAGLSRHFTEGSALQWSWYVLHRPQWLVGAMGGRVAFERRLDAFFAGTLYPGAPRGVSQDVTGLIGDYAHGNEPCHHVIGLYRMIGREDKAAKLERQVCERFYRPTPGGLCGNDDCGQMSAWYLRHGKVMRLTQPRR